MVKDRWFEYAFDGVKGEGYDPRKNQDDAPKVTLARKVDYRDRFESVLDQGEHMKSSLACAMTAVADFTFRQTPWRGPYAPLSARYMHYRMREVHRLRSNAGDATGFYTARLAFHAYGAVPEALWPYDPMKLGEVPPDDVVAKAVSFEVYDYRDDPWDGPDGIYRELHEGRVVAFSYVGPPAFLQDAGNNDGKMREWTGKRGDAGKNGHAMVVVGYDLDKEMLICRNSMGKDWGDEGYCWMPKKNFDAHAFDWFNYGPSKAKPETRMMGGVSNTQQGHERVEAAVRDMRAKMPAPVRGSLERSGSLDPSRRSESAESSATESRASLRGEIQADLKKSVDESKMSIRDRLRAQEDKLAQNRNRGGGGEGGNGR